MGAGGRNETAQGTGQLRRRSDGGLDAAGKGDPGGRRERQRRQPHFGRGHARAAVTGVGDRHIPRQTRRHERGQCDLAPTAQREPSGERREGREGKTERLERVGKGFGVHGANVTRPVVSRAGCRRGRWTVVPPLRYLTLWR